MCSILLLSIGVLAGMAFFYGAIWADVESVFYGFNRYGNKMSSFMHCPILINSQEGGEITAVIKNSSDRQIRPNVSFEASSISIIRSETTHLTLVPGEKKTLTWDVTNRDIALDHLIFARVYTFASYPQADLEKLAASSSSTWAGSPAGRRPSWPSVSACWQ